MTVSVIQILYAKTDIITIAEQNADAYFRIENSGNVFCNIFYSRSVNETADYKTVDFGDMSQAFGIVMTKEANGKWEMDHIRNGAEPVCYGTASGWYN